MWSIIRRLRLGLIGAGFFAAVAVAPAAAFGTPTLTDTGSSFATVRVSGTSFSPSNWVYVESIDRRTGYVSTGGWVQTTAGGCAGFYCWFGGAFSFYGEPNTGISQCGGQGRDVWAYDYGYYGWVGPLPVGCA